MMTNPPDGPQSPPSGVAAKTAGVMASVGAVVWGVFTYGDLLSLAHRSTDEIVRHNENSFSYKPAGVWVGWPSLIEAVSATVLLLAGAVALLRRRSVGRLLIVIGCGVVIAAIYCPLFLSYDYSFGDFIGASVFALFPILTMVLALVPSTRRWCQSSKQRGNVSSSEPAESA